MHFRFGGELPDDHPFLERFRSLVDWSFKFISWLIITATLGVAAQVTKDPWLYGLYFLCHVLLIFFLQAFFSWLFTMKIPGGRSRKEPAAPRRGWWAWMHKARRMLIAIFAFLVWGCFQLGMQQAIGRTVDAIAEFQKTNRK
ncbi:hypothetical protein KIP88_37990 [Bradyrhizobium sp. SRL28]|uniref:hypothetical protein n=1 Tax=Bradyrhizobium sp. SRL28 TaxID=2836178 RepID=UPI001BDE9BB6|nr:hypothetical protein [Bradyrhizobium sp. SRL28]MBT1516250.1 hypothetical protein [Bradyrhizobium sp. SRL28]